MVKIVTLVGDDNQIYQALVEGKSMRTLPNSKSGPMTFTSLAYLWKDEEQADDCLSLGE